MAFSQPPSSTHRNPNPQAAQAAVAIIRTRGQDPEFLLLRRATNPKDPWSGHFALPGGRRDPGDADLLETCMRETFEETGIRLEPGQLIHPLPMAVAGGHMGRPMEVAPYLFEIPSKPVLALAAAEIAAFHWLAQSYLCDPANRHQAALSVSHPEREFPCIRVGNETGAIWGFTYGVLETLWGAAIP